MNAPARPLDLVQLIPLTSITPSETRVQALRRKRYSMENLADLRQSVAKVGVQQPIVVRKLKAMRGLASYEIAFGERRWRAASQAGLADIPAIVRELTDPEVLEIQLVENLQREDLHPLEEAAGYEELMKVGKIRKEDLGDRVGKSRSWVYSRMNLLKLEGPARTALEAGTLDVSRALVVASVASPNERAAVLEKALQLGGNDKPVYSVRELRAEAVNNRLTMPLRGAPFDVTDTTINPARGACGGCQYRTGNCDPEALDPDVCTDAVCFHGKVKEAGIRRRKAILAGGGKVLTGEAARMISPSVNTVYGHVDLDLVCEADDFPEEEPAMPKGVDYDVWEQHPLYVTWREKEKLWQPRTYRQLLEGCKFESVIIDDPKTKALRELVPFSPAQKLLKQKGIDLPSYFNKKRQTFHRGNGASSGEPKADSPAAKAKREAAEKKRLEEQAIEQETNVRVLELVKQKFDGELGVPELAYIGGNIFEDIEEDLSTAMFKLLGVKDPGWDAAKLLQKHSLKDASRMIACGLVAQSLSNGGFRGVDPAAEALLTRLKIDKKKIAAEVKTKRASAAIKASPGWPFATTGKAPVNAKAAKK